MRNYLSLLFLTIVLLAAPAIATAQADLRLGPRVGIDVGDANELFIGADARIGLEDIPVVLNPTFDYYFAPENVTYFALGANGLYALPLEDQDFLPYVGGGLGIFRSSVDIPGVGSVSNTDVGINLIGGAEYETGGITPFGQGVLNIGGDFTLFGLTVGLLFEI